MDLVINHFAYYNQISLGEENSSLFKWKTTPSFKVGYFLLIDYYDNLLAFNEHSASQKAFNYNGCYLCGNVLRKCRYKSCFFFKSSSLKAGFGHTGLNSNIGINRNFFSKTIFKNIFLKNHLARKTEFCEEASSRLFFHKYT